MCLEYCGTGSFLEMIYLQEGNGQYLFTIKNKILPSILYLMRLFGNLSLDQLVVLQEPGDQKI